MTVKYPRGLIGSELIRGVDKTGLFSAIMA